jgi:ubiquitin C-terminal hydrolase
MRRADITLCTESLTALVSDKSLGVHVQGGHYTVYIKRDGRWFLCDDWTVKPVEEEDAHDPRAYMLHYRSLS